MQKLSKIKKSINTKIVLVFIFISLLCTLSSCENPFIKKLDDYPNTKWVCDEPDIWFKVGKETQIPGEIKTNGEIKSIIVMYNYGTSIYFFPSNKLDKNGGTNSEYLLIKGEYTFSKNKLIVKVSDDSLFNNKYKELVFNRESIDK